MNKCYFSGTMKAIRLLCFCSMILAVLVQPVSSSSCLASIAPQLRKDCHPDPGAFEASCLARNCCWSPLKTLEIPWCFEKVDLCSVVPDSERIDCHPDPGANEEACVSRGCQWCASDNTTAPFCFYNSREEATCSTRYPIQKRIDCHPHPGASQEGCETKGCFWCPTTIANVPWCFYPADGPYGYVMKDAPQKTALGWRLTLIKRDSISLFGNDISPVVMDVEFHTEDRLRFKVYDPNNKRFEVPLDIESSSNLSLDPNYDVEFVDNTVLQFKVMRKQTRTVLWETTFGGLIFSNQYIQMMTSVPSTSVYGFGEHEHPSFKHDMNFVRYGMFSRDQSPTAFSNLYGVHPFYMCIENDFNAHGVLLLNSNAQDVTLSPFPSLTFRTIGGILDFYMFLGPTPENVIQQYTEAIGRPYIPPYWSLGFQLSRWGYNSLDVLKKTVERLKQYDIPHDVQYGDIDQMEHHLDFTYDKASFAGLPEYIKELKNDGIHYVIILDPFVTKDEPLGTYKPYELGEDLGIWINNSDGFTPAIGKAWPPGDSVYPDYTNPQTAEWLTQMCIEYKNTIDFDGIWINMNEPANFLNGQQSGCEENNLNYPPYVPDITGGLLAERTLCPNSKTFLGYHYDTHSLFGWSQAKLTFYACQNATGNRAFVLSCSTFAGSGKYTGHWLGDNFSRWKDMHMSIIGMLEFNLFGIPYVGADICGFNEETTYELCLRWMQLGAFYPFSRNHNAIGNKEQDPGAFGEEFATISRSALRIRYLLLPYLYTLFYQSHVSGSTVVRGLMHEFTSDPETQDIDRAFLWGPALMITPVLEEGARSVSVYFPEASWFDFYTGGQVSPSWQKKSVEVPAPLDIIPLFIRGGYILPTQLPARTTELSRMNPFSLIIALDERGEASGSLFWDDGDSIDSVEKDEYFYVEYQFSNRALNATVVKNGYRGIASLVYGTVQILGFTSKPNVIFVNGDTVPASRIQYHSNGKITLWISAPLFQDLSISFEN
ncbi:maltase-glucoamylase, intestinal [Rousettus aegyptiacus]|uniref:alpha-glucosidase n=5 Tax=Rousettus aegyptiacus TaxID=9407 RepID=A0A7J8JGJ9_ROUAE|nr:maltase-glucoamylase, intestinal [Rousettus aegyptiacus]XP_036092513.1 maltase-glucoamylase, intestinal [Rousettus aegyptiacus]XP_036092514.1 maltase-glucoamylase, intestinal [Rousettus aegyptiacus]XP_036092515.1 maltase-glucoamylase, intestinal [Rousettus aegyptiacus]XP_036092516.1 maltase-glucoamylase, intestinal [Rousettus aegyptiacus]XP_036092517.1 maltase-glucoamylase, intestinal [Rousettus aegyptiacus]XP_036092518.1 maltase-glucoamylase, intestinal [Rousettus aegyptiacus]XP_03609251